MEKVYNVLAVSVTCSARSGSFVTLRVEDTDVTVPKRLRRFSLKLSSYELISIGYPPSYYLTLLYSTIKVTYSDDTFASVLRVDKFFKGCCNDA